MRVGGRGPKSAHRVPDGRPLAGTREASSAVASLAHYIHALASPARPAGACGGLYFSRVFHSIEQRA